MDPVKSPSVLLEQSLCPHCLGRGFAKIGRGLTNKQRGELIIYAFSDKSKESLLAEEGKEDSALEFLRSISDISNQEPMELEVCSPSDCWLCDGLMDEITYFAEILAGELEDYEFDNFLVGSKIDGELISREEELFLRAGLNYPESIKAELNREIGKKVNEKLGIPTEFDNPEIVAIIDTRFNTGIVNPSPIFIYGRYLKLERGIPQTKWFCRKCRGFGCDNCGGTGKLYDISVEELIGEPAMKLTEAVDFALHGSGREDIDALMLGNGRPFVLELSRPKKRKIEMAELAQEINEANSGRIEVLGLRESNREEMIAGKMGKYYKTYRCRILAETSVPNEKLKNVVNSFVKRVITQRTPIRVSHRRADKYRKKTVAGINIESKTDTGFVLDIKAESGLYIKELIHGDESGTQPNLSDELGVSCEVQKLDVIRFHDDED